MERGAHDAVRARSVEVLEIPGATRLLHLERAEARRPRLLEAVTEALH